MFFVGYREDVHISFLFCRSLIEMTSFEYDCNDKLQLHHPLPRHLYRVDKQNDLSRSGREPSDAFRGVWSRYRDGDRFHLDKTGGIPLLPPRRLARWCFWSRIPGDDARNPLVKRSTRKISRVPRKVGYIVSKHVRRLVRKRILLYISVRMKHLWSIYDVEFLHGDLEQFGACAGKSPLWKPASKDF